MSDIEIIAVISGFLCVFLTIRENIWCWPAGLIQVSLYIFIFYDAKLYSDVILHIIYVFMQFYGWYYWLHGGQKNDRAAVTTQSQPWLLATLTLAIVATAFLGHTMASRTDASFPYGDAFTTCFSLTAQWLMSRKKLESWYYWIAVDIIAIGIYYSKDLKLTAGLYTAFLIMAIIGLVKWRRSCLEQSTAAEAELCTGVAA